MELNPMKNSYSCSPASAWWPPLLLPTKTAHTKVRAMATTVRSMFPSLSKAARLPVLRSSNHTETDMIIQAPIDNMIPEIIKKNGTKGVETIAGATNSSKGILAGVAACSCQSSVISAEQSFFERRMNSGGLLRGLLYFCQWKNLLDGKYSVR